jgi:hypothetical protein
MLWCKCHEVVESLHWLERPHTAPGEPTQALLSGGRQAEWAGAGGGSWAAQTTFPASQPPALPTAVKRLTEAWCYPIRKVKRLYPTGGELCPISSGLGSL